MTTQVYSPVDGSSWPSRTRLPVPAAAVESAKRKEKTSCRNASAARDTRTQIACQCFIDQIVRQNRKRWSSAM